MADQDPQQQPADQKPAAPAWYGDAKYEGVATAKGWKAVGDVFDAYTNLERIQRTPAARTLVLPEKEDDADGWGQVYTRLGRPEKPDMYKLEGFEPVEGQADIVRGENGFLAAAHKAGISQRQANDIYKWYAGVLEGEAAQSAEQLRERNSADFEGMRQEWGNAFDSNVGLAKYAVSALGVSQEDLDKIENALGTKWLMTTFHRIGQGLTAEPGAAQSNAPEDRDPSGGFGVTPAAAQAKISELLNDPAFYKRYMEGGKAEFERIRILTESAAGKAPAGRGRVIR